MDTTTQSSEQEQQNVTHETQEGSGKEEGPTHWSVLESNIRAMKVVELREELELRGLDSKGLKNHLMQRLLDSVEKEKESDQKKEDQSVAAATVPSISNAMLLSEAIRNGDDRQLISLVNRVRDDSQIYAAIKELPVEDVLPFLKYIDELMRQQKLENYLHTWLVWMQKVMKIHAEYLSKVPDLNSYIGKTQEWMEKRVRNMDKLLQLQGKLKFFIQGIPEERHFARTEKPLLTYDMDHGFINKSPQKQEVMQDKKANEKRQSVVTIDADNDERQLIVDMDSDSA